MKVNKSKHRTRLTDDNLESSLRLCIGEINPNIDGLVSQIQAQVSHRFQCRYLTFVNSLKYFNERRPAVRASRRRVPRTAPPKRCLRPEGAGHSTGGVVELPTQEGRFGGIMELRWSGSLKLGGPSLARWAGRPALPRPPHQAIVDYAVYTINHEH
ncbi:hypothetical protein EVAR_55368_1 [Eumeta japonica]|uniref:Uncharacterized protein n=1 Tax=Eumeta variegata TaxID=151549 RepID=A0A4C1YVR7_EUMVA|nr:hypothetical protein EVAR_55368_1 [Eumeta japonica]